MPDCGTISPGLYSCATVVLRSNLATIPETGCNRTTFRPGLSPAIPLQNSISPALAEKQVFDQRGGAEQQHDDDEQADQAHAPHHPAAHHLIHHGYSLPLTPRPARPAGLPACGLQVASL